MTHYTVLTLMLLGSSPAGDEEPAVTALRALGARVQQISRDSDLLEVDFHLEGRSVTDADLHMLGELPRITRLNLAGTQVTDAGLAHLKTLTDLTHLYLQNTTIQGPGLEHLRGLQRLTYLNLYGTAVNDAALTPLESLLSLRRVFLWQTGVTVEGALALMDTLPELAVDLGAEVGALVRPPVYTEEGIAAARRRLAEIGADVRLLSRDGDEIEVDFHLRGVGVKDEDLAVLADLPHLVEVHLGGTQVTDEGLRHLAAIRDLRRLQLQATKVTDQGLAALVRMHHLVSLNLYGTAVTDAGLESLRPLRSLERLYLWNTAVTEAGAARLRERRPGLSVNVGWNTSVAAATGQEVAAATAKKDLTCCEKAKAAGEACAHPCCVEAAKAGKLCEKCNPGS